MKSLNKDKTGRATTEPERRATIESDRQVLLDQSDQERPKNTGKGENRKKPGLVEIWVLSSPFAPL